MSKKMKTKQCAKCNRSLEVNEDNFHKNGNSFRSCCKECRNEKARERRQSSRKTKKKVISKHKICPKCCVKYLKEEGFDKNRANKDGFASWCKECKAEDARKRYKRKADEIKEKQATYVEKHRERIRRRQVWSDMRRRCYGKGNRREFAYYRDRGIEVCEEWQDFRNFDKWLLDNNWKKGMVIHRANSDEDYCPENCTLVTVEEHQSIHAGWS